MPVDPRGTHIPLVYVSYAWGDDSDSGKQRETIVDQLCHSLEKDGLDVGRDKRRQGIGDSIEDFAADISRADLVLLVVSQKYLRSSHCMVEELYQIYSRCFANRKEFQNKTCLLLLDDAVLDIRVTDELVDHWQTVERTEKERLEKLDPERTSSPEAWKAWKRTGEMIRCLMDILSALRDPVMPRGSLEISHDEFSAIRSLVRQRLDNIKRWRRQRSSLIPATDEFGEDRASLAPSGMASDVHFLALIFRRGHRRVETLDWDTPRPWELHHYQWSAQEYDSILGKYKIAGDLGKDVGPTIVAGAAHEADSDSGVKDSTIRDLLGSAEAWMAKDENRNKIFLLELFVPVELLLFDWSSVLLPSVEDFAADDEATLLQSRPYVLRSADRLSKNWSLLKSKYAQMVRGKGLWLCGDLDRSTVGTVQEKDELVAIKRLTPPEDQPKQRLIWRNRVVETMAPLSLWLRHAGATHDEPVCHQYFVDHYEDLLSGRSDHDPVNPGCQNFERLSRLRRACNGHPLSKDLVLLVDHPDRQPLSPSISERAQLSH